MKRNVANFSKVTAILRGYDCETVDVAIQALLESPITAVEITLNRRDSVDIISSMVQKYGERISVGAGTVLSMEHLISVVKAGADFVLSPTVFTKEMLAYCRVHKVLSVPGAYSPSEILQSFRDGADIVKIFPASTVGSRYFRDLQAPLGRRPFMAVGGINANNVEEYFKAGASFVGIASGLFNKEDVLAHNLAGMRRAVKDFFRNREVC